LAHYLQPDDSLFPVAECPMLRPRRTGETIQVEHDSFVRKDGTQVAVSYSSAPVDLADGRGAVVAFRDTSARLQLGEVDARIRCQIGAVVPVPAGPWSAQVPAIADPERRAHLTEIAALMDARKDCIGEHATENTLPWAVAALGPVTADPLDRLDWQRRAASIGAWRVTSWPTDSASPARPPHGHTLGSPESATWWPCQASA
jgi:hypothetical protein